MKRIILVLCICLAVLTGVAGHAEQKDAFDLAREKLYNLDPTDYKGLFDMTKGADGAFAATLSGAMRDWFYGDPHAFVKALTKYDASRQVRVMETLIWGEHSSNVQAHHPFLILEDELSLIENPSDAEIAMIRRIQDQIEIYTQNNIF